MYSHEVLAVLTAYDRKNRASSAFELPENSRWFHKAVRGVAGEPTINSRETTPAIDDLQFEDEEANAVDRLVVTFDKLIENLQNGMQWGTNPTSSHILLGHRGTTGISARQCNITVDDDLCIWLHDYHSTHGTAVSHKGRNQKEIHSEKPTIHLGSLAIKIEFPNHRAGHPHYIENLEVFVKKCKEAAEKSKEDVLAVGGLGLDSEPITQAPSEVQTLCDRLIYYRDQVVGKGQFGKVHRVIRMRDGKIFAAKIFKPPANKRKLGEVDPVWLTNIRREFTIIEDNPHPNIIQVFEFREIPDPMIIMVNYPCGSIVDAGVNDDTTYISALGQILDGLSHLHAKGVVHRDLKPDNFLVEKSPFFKVVLTDFGMSKVKTDTTLLTRFCGTLKYMAPEVFPDVGESHGPLADIWSLGVIALEWIYSIPPPPTTPKPNQRGMIPPERWYTWIHAWSTKLFDKLDDEDEGQVVDILHHMIEFNVEDRWDARKCLTQGYRNGLFKRRQADGLVSASNSGDHVLSTEEGGVRTKTPTAASLPQL